MKTWIILCTLLSCCVLITSALAGGNQSGPITGPTTWTGTNYLVGDVTIGVNGVLTLSKADNCEVIAMGDWRIIVDGGLLVVTGAGPDNKVSLTWNSSIDHWGGLLIKKFASPSIMRTLEYLLIEHANIGLEVTPNLGSAVYLTVSHCRIQYCGTGVVMQKMASPESCFRLSNCSIMYNTSDGFYGFNLPLKAPFVGSLGIFKCEIAYNGACGIHLDRGGGALKIYENKIHDNMQVPNPADNGVTCIVSSPSLYKNQVLEPNGYALGCAVSGAPTLTNGVNTWQTTNGYAVMHFRNAGATLFKAHNNIKHVGAPPLLIFDESYPAVLRKVAYNFWLPAPTADYFIPYTSFAYAPYDLLENSLIMPQVGTSSLEDSIAYDLLTEALEAEEAENYAVAYDMFMEVVATYPDVDDAVCQALPHILNTGAQIDEPFDEMYDFFDAILQQNASSLVGKTARQCRNDCHVALEIFDDPIADYSSIAAAPPSLTDYVFAELDLNQISVIMEYLGLPGPQALGNRPRTLEDYRAKEAELFALFESGSLNNQISPPENYATVRNYPNPFNPNTTIQFTLPEAANVELAIYDCSGRWVTTLVNGWRNEGINELTFDAANLASGIYICHMTAGSYEAAQKLILLK